MSSPTGLTYNLFVTNLAAMAVVKTATTAGIVLGVDQWFNILIPQALNYAELRIQRDLDLNALLTNSSTYSLSTGTNTVSIALTDFITVETIQAVVAGVPTPLSIAAKEYIQAIWGDPSATGVPVDFAVYGGDAATQGDTSMVFLFGPYADQNYPLQVTGRARAASLYANSGNQTTASTVMTFISQWLPDLLLQAAMIIVSQYQRNFTATANDPQMPGSYEAQYQTLLKGAIVEEARKKWQSSAWSSLSPPLVATPTRG